MVLFHVHSIKFQGALKPLNLYNNGYFAKYVFTDLASHIKEHITMRSCQNEVMLQGLVKF